MVFKQIMIKAEDPKIGLTLDEITSFVFNAATTSGSDARIRSRVGFRGQVLQLWTEKSHPAESHQREYQ